MKTLGWKSSCACAAETVPPTCLDPFVGSGTVTRVARRLGYRAIGIDLNPEFLAIAAKRTFDGDDEVTVKAKTRDFDAKWRL